MGTLQFNLVQKLLKNKPQRTKWQISWALSGVHLLSLLLQWVADSIKWELEHSMLAVPQPSKDRRLVKVWLTTLWVAPLERLQQIRWLAHSALPLQILWLSRKWDSHKWDSLKWDSHKQI